MTGIDQQQDQLISAYIRGTADPEDVARLEEAMLDDDELFERVQQEALLQRGLKTTLIETDPIAESKPSFWRWPGFALLGTLGLAVVVLGGWIVQLQQKIDHLQAPQTGIPVITLHDQRSILAPSQESTAFPNEGPILIEMDVSAYEDTQFRLELQSGGKIHHWENLSADDRGYITVYSSGFQLPARIRLVSEKPDATERFNVLIPE